MSRPQRRKVYIDTSVQGALARRIILHWLVFLGVASLVAFVMQVLSDPFRPLAEHARDMWWNQGPFLVVMLFLLPVFVVDTVKISHRFAGPIFSLRRAIREITQGKPARRLQFRTGDFWHDLSEDFNAMLVHLGLLDDEVPSDSDQQERETTQPAGAAEK
jgi:nitrogen fixation/metabolism regulation signal transduction histidine kinase